MNLEKREELIEEDLEAIMDFIRKVDLILIINIKDITKDKDLDLEVEEEV